MEKKCFVALLMVVVMMCACWTGAVAEDERDYQYALLDDGTVEITGYNGKAEKLTIPNMLNGKKVTSIDNRAFYLCNSLISIIIPDSVEKISVNPFAYCRTLKSIFVSSEHPYFFAIDGVLFRKADSCLISYPKGREYTTYNIPQGITAIESSAFYDCKFLTRVTIPDSVTSIGDCAFSLCDSLTSITIPDSVEKISVNPFAYCRTLKSIFVSSEHPYFFAIDGVLFRKADSCLISYPKGREYTTYNIPQGITAIESSAFYDCKFLTRVTIPDSVTSIGDCAFSLCDSLTSITIPDSVEQIGTNPFTVCSALKSISVSPEHPYFATIDGVLFRKADKALISYPAGISSSTYTIPQGITAIGDSAFYYCDSLTSVSIPDSVTSIGDNAFYFCESLTSVTIPDSVTAIGDSAFSYCDSLTSVSIPDSVTAIGDEAFYSCSSLTSVNIPDSVTSIGDRAFSYCDSLTSVSIPDSVTAIGNRAFYYCDSLTSVSIPNSVTSIGDYAFGDCSNLTLTVPRNSYALEYAKTNNIPYTYPDANDWLNN